jgi:FkbM family methyltransferase
MSDLILQALKIHKISSLVHIGGHIGQEVNFYKSLDLDNVIFFEPVNEFADHIENKIRNLSNFVLHRCALGNQNSSKTIYIADKGKKDDSGSTSLKEPQKSNITFSTTRTIEVKKYSSFKYSRIDLAILDTQGYELEVLEGFESKINTFKFLIVEFSNYEGYKNQTIYKDLNNFLCLNNFSFVKQNKKVMKVFPNSQAGSHGDALYINNKLINRFSISKAKFRYFILNNILIDFLIKYTKVAFWKAKVKKLINY